jgi:hypothetical protein
MIGLRAVPRLGRRTFLSGSVWVTADVHYAGTFGPSELDLTFGPQVRYEVMTVSLHDLKGDTLFRVSLNPE